MRLLIVEDESKTANYLKKGLTENGFIVDLATDGENGFFLASNYHYDLAILDIMLPKMDGLTLLNELRRIKPTLRILFLSARDDVKDKVKGLEQGADDYLAKPFAFSELLARVRTLLRRKEVLPTEKLCFSDLEVDIVRHRVVRNGQRIDLTPKEFALLVLFMERMGEILSRTFIAEAVWDINFDSDTNVIDVAVKRLRQKLDDSFEKKFIHTIRGMGYLFEERK